MSQNPVADRAAARSLAHQTGAYPAPLTDGRSRNMQAIRRTGTKPEVRLRTKALHALGYRYRKDFPVVVQGLRVRPDIVFTRKKVAVFVDGCFWHRCPEHSRPPGRNAEYWGAKFVRNTARDALVTTRLGSEGWTVIRIWEHERLEDAVGVVAATLLGA